ncbi:MAG: hypothetical protein O3B24_09930 [Verrucomicrobia bacterium]|nr:hypothetical protein [Verrucomicrobiota bacterium]
MRLAILLAALSLFAWNSFADESLVQVNVAPETVTTAETVTTEATPVSAPTFVVFLPEQVDSEWLWFRATDASQHIVQSAVEKTLIRAGFDVIDLGTIQRLKDGGSIQDLTSVSDARAAAQMVNATYAIVGTATAVRGGQSSAYGVNVARSNAEISAKILRVADGKILAIEDASAQAGGQAARAAGQAALKDAAALLARKLATAAKRITQAP